MSARACHYCGVTAEELAKEDRELRPYGPGGSPICFPCMKAEPEREAAAGRAFDALLDAAATIGGGVAVIGTDEGPTPYAPPEAGGPR